MVDDIKAKRLPNHQAPIQLGSVGFKVVVSVMLTCIRMKIAPRA